MIPAKIEHIVDQREVCLRLEIYAYEAQVPKVASAKAISTAACGTPEVTAWAASVTARTSTVSPQLAPLARSSKACAVVQ